MSTATLPTYEQRIKTRLPEEFRHEQDASPLATFLGVFSIRLGLWELLGPRSVADSTGVRYPGILRAYGLREIGAGVGILTNHRPAGWLWARVAGDVLDLATIGAAYAQANTHSDRQKALLAAGAVAGVMALDVACAQAHSG